MKALLGNSYDILFRGTIIFGNVPVRIDALSGWFILIINFTMITGALYGFNYMKKYREMKSEIYPALYCFYFYSFCFDWYLFCSEWVYLSVVMGINGSFCFCTGNI